MTSMQGKNFILIKNIIKSNNAIKKSTLKTVRDFLELQERFIEAISSVYECLGTIKDVTNIFLDDEKRKVLIEFQPYEKVQLAVCGYNSSGKASFLHEFLECGKFLPTGTGATTARIVKFSYAADNEACLIRYSSVIDPIEVENSRKDLSSCFVDYSTKKKIDTKKLKEIVKPDLTRPEGYDVHSPEFEKWASDFIEIRIPSPVLELGIEVYDTAGFLACDAPILRHNLLGLVATMRPSLLFLYDNATVSDDSRQSFDQLKLTLSHHFLGTGIFFLNTKVDIGTILNDNDDEDQQKLIQNERLQRYNLLLQVNEMSSELSGGNGTTLEECDCFDIFTILQPEHTMAQTIKKSAIDRIIHFTAKHDLQSTQQVSNIMLAVIDAFFDFVLITNRRSSDEWNKLQDEALLWGKEFFQQYRSHIDKIIEEAKRCIPQRFKERRDNIEKRAIDNCKRKPWWEKNAVVEITTLPVRMANAAAEEISGRDNVDEDLKFIILLVENEVVKPILSKIICETSSDIRFSMNQKLLLSNATKNELLNVAYREVFMHTNNVKSFAYPHDGMSVAMKTINILTTIIYIPFCTVACSVLIPMRWVSNFIKHGQNSVHSALTAQTQQKRIRNYLSDVENMLSNISNHLQNSLMNWMDTDEKEFTKKINSYHRFAIKTINHRRRAYELARTFSSQFARIECRLVANLDLAEHNGSSPIIEQDPIGAGGFFFVYPASWGDKESLVVKVLRDPIANRDFAYMEAHFHRVATRLSVDHMVPLRYLYEEPDEPQKLFIFLPRYPANLYEYLMAHVNGIYIDKAVQVTLNIAHVVMNMHAHGLIHRDIKVANILIDANEQAFLADFGACQHGIDNSIIIRSRPFPPELATRTNSSSSDNQFSNQGTALDVFSLGVLLYTVALKKPYHIPSVITQTHVDAMDKRFPETYRGLIRRCINDDPKARPTVKEVISKLEMIAEEVESSRPCLICSQQPRYARCIPCRHKTMCETCLANIQQANAQPKCILCRKVFTNTE